MLPKLTVWGLEIDLALALLVGYVVILWLAAWLLEFLAKAHFRRARQLGHAGFTYRAEFDHYECPQGELLTLHRAHHRDKLAIYKAPASKCSGCVLKARCTPHDEGRHIYRSLAEFHETDVGRFHRWLSLVVLGLALAFSAGGLLAWRNNPAQWLLVFTTGLSIILLWLVAHSVEPPRKRVEPHR